MDGKELTKAVLEHLDDLSQGGKAIKQRRIWKCLDAACAIFCRATRLYKSSATLTTVLSTQHYDLPPDLLGLWMKRDRRFFVRYYDGINYFWPRVVPWETIFNLNLTEAQETPNRVAIRERETVEANITGTTTASGAASGGIAILTDSAAAFLTTERVWPRDVIHNETDGSDGYVVSVIDGTHLQCCLFEGKTNGFGSGDAYTIIPAAEKQLSLEAPAATAGHTITVPYLAMPDPVYADTLAWRLPAHTCRAIAAGAAALLKLPENSLQEAQVMNAQFVEEIRRVNAENAGQLLAMQRRPASSGW